MERLQEEPTGGEEKVEGKSASREEGGGCQCGGRGRNGGVKRRGDTLCKRQEETVGLAREAPEEHLAAWSGRCLGRATKDGELMRRCSLAIEELHSRGRASSRDAPPQARSTNGHACAGRVKREPARPTTLWRRGALHAPPPAPLSSTTPVVLARHKQEKGMQTQVEAVRATTLDGSPPVGTRPRAARRRDTSTAVTPLCRGSLHAHARAGSWLCLPPNATHTTAVGRLLLGAWPHSPDLLIARGVCDTRLVPQKRPCAERAAGKRMKEDPLVTIPAKRRPGRVMTWEWEGGGHNLERSLSARVRARACKNTTKPSMLSRYRQGIQRRAQPRTDLQRWMRFQGLG